MGDERRAIALVAEAPDGPRLGGLEIRQAELGTGVGKIRHRVETLDRKAREAIHHHPLGGRGPGRDRQPGQPAETQPDR
jgi:hypothetical protein